MAAGSTMDVERTTHGSGRHRSGAGQALAAEIGDALEAGRLDLPALPDMARRIQGLTGDPGASAIQMANLLSSDPVVYMYVIRAANSAELLDGGSPATNLYSAVSRLGCRMLFCLVMNVAVTRLFQAGSPLVREQLARLWQHCREVAANSYVLAQRQGHLRPEQAMLAGLVHGIGALPLYLHADRSHHHFDQSALEQLADEFSAIAGARLLQSWNFPEELVAVAAEHDNLFRVNHSGVADYVDVVAIANLQASCTAKPVAWKNVMAAERLGYYAGDCRNFLSDHAEQLAAARDMLGISATRLSPCEGATE